MDRTGNVYFVRGGGIVSSLGGTVATEKFSVDTSGWDESKFRKSIEGGSISFGISGSYSYFVVCPVFRRALVCDV